MTQFIKTYSKVGFENWVSSTRVDENTGGGIREGSDSKSIKSGTRGGGRGRLGHRRAKSCSRRATSCTILQHRATSCSNKIKTNGAKSTKITGITQSGASWALLVVAWVIIAWVVVAQVVVAWVVVAWVVVDSWAAFKSGHSGLVLVVDAHHLNKIN